MGIQEARRRSAGRPCHARTVAQVIESKMPGLAAGDFVFNTNGWAEYGLMGEGVARPSYMIPRRLDPKQGRISQAVGVLGMLGLTAYAGMILMGDPKKGETAVVSAASGGVGQIAGQLARLRGARVVGIAGREEKCRFVVDELGFDACVSHLSPTFASDLRAACPGGIDVYFENVGGAVFDAVLPLFNKGARMTICGLIAHYGDDAGTDARAALMKRGEAIFRERGVTVRDLFVGDFVEKHHDAFLAKSHRGLRPATSSIAKTSARGSRRSRNASPKCCAATISVKCSCRSRPIRRFRAGKQAVSGSRPS